MREKPIKRTGDEENAFGIQASKKPIAVQYTYNFEVIQSGEFVEVEPPIKRQSTGLKYTGT